MPDQVNNRTSTPIYILMVVLVVGMVMGIWHLRHEMLTRRLLTWKAYEVYPLAWASQAAKESQHTLFIYYKYAKVVKFKETWALGNKIGLYYAIIPVLLAAWFARKAMKNPILKAKKVHTIQSLLESQSHHFSAVAPILQRDLTNDRSPEWASSMHPEEWVAEYGLIVNEEVDVERARALFVQQLGRPVSSFGKFAPHERALFAVFGLRVFFKDTKASQKLIDQLNHSANNPESKPDFSLATAQFKRCVNNKQAKKWVMKHRYVRTLLMAMLIEARQTGVLPSSNFIWLKPYDRGLWYPLNTAGRKVPFIEAAAVFTQMQAEEVAWDNDCVLTAPYVEEAVLGLRRYLEDTGILEPREAKS